MPIPPAVVTNEDGDAGFIRAFVSITEKTENGTVRHPRDYLNPLLMLDGKPYASMRFGELRSHICNALRGDRPRLVLETLVQIVSIYSTLKSEGVKNNAYQSPFRILQRSPYAGSGCGGYSEHHHEFQEVVCGSQAVT